MDNMALAGHGHENCNYAGLHVPYGCSRMRFDDAIESLTSTPPINHRSPAIAKRWAGWRWKPCWHITRGKSVPPRMFLPTTLLMRRSCAAFLKAVCKPLIQGTQIAKPKGKTTDTTKMPGRVACWRHGGGFIGRSATAMSLLNNA